MSRDGERGAGSREQTRRPKTTAPRSPLPAPVLHAKSLVRALQGAYARGDRQRTLLQLVATRMRQAGGPYTGVYLYMLHGDTLELEAFDGRPTEHACIPVGKGLCGRAVAEARDINAADVAAEPDYLACSIETRSELVVLIRRGTQILGQIDVDSDVPSGLNAVEHAAVRDVADALAALL